MSYPISYPSVWSRDRAFGEALEQLFAAHPLWEGAHEMYHVTRSSALRKARNGGYRDYGPGKMQRWRDDLQYIFAPDWRVPPDEVLALHLLIYE